MAKIRNEEIRRRLNTQPAEQTSNKNRIRWWSHVKRMVPTTKGKATKSLGRQYTEVVHEFGDPDDRSKQLGEGHTSD